MEKKIYAKLFGEHEFLSKEHLDMFLEVMDSEIAKQTLISAVKTAYDRGVYHIGEVEIISKCIRVLVNTEEKDS